MERLACCVVIWRIYGFRLIHWSRHVFQFVWQSNCTPNLVHVALIIWLLLEVWIFKWPSYEFWFVFRLNSAIMFQHSALICSYIHFRTELDIVLQHVTLTCTGTRKELGSSNLYLTVTSNKRWWNILSYNIK